MKAFQSISHTLHNYNLNRTVMITIPLWIGGGIDLCPYSLPIWGEKYLFVVGVAMIVLPVDPLIFVSSTVSMSMCSVILRTCWAIKTIQMCANRQCIKCTFVVFSCNVCIFVLFDVCVYSNELVPHLCSKPNAQKIQMSIYNSYINMRL